MARDRKLPSAMSFPRCDNPVGLDRDCKEHPEWEKER